MSKSVLVVCCFFLMISCKKEVSKEEMDSVSVAEDTVAKPAALADSKYTEIGEKILADMEKGDMDSWMEVYADNAVYELDKGDSLVGKPAIASYWKQRRANVIEKINFEDEMWLPIKVDNPEKSEAKGTWLHGWFKGTVKNRNEKETTHWVHIDYHFDSNDKVDRVIQYIDRDVVDDPLHK